MRVTLFLGRGFLIGLVLIVIISLTIRQAPDPLTTINIKSISGLQYDLVRFTVKPEEKIKLIFSNADDMSHNLLITSPGSRVDVVEAALQLEEKGPKMDYIPKSSNILWSIPVIAPGESKTLTFTAPKNPGVYPYVCTFPGHGYIMYGAMYVSVDGKMPDKKEDPNIPPSRRQDNSGEKKNTMDHTSMAKSVHPYEPKPPYLYRTYMEDASPAAIAVSLPQELSYCWDAGTCRLRYAWEGGFVNGEKLWKGKPNAFAEIIGNIFYKDNTPYPILIGNPVGKPEIEFKGYQLIDGYPEFHYTFNGTDVYELIYPKDDGTGLTRTFRIPGADQEVSFLHEPHEAIEYKASAGSWQNGQLRLSPEEAKEFTVTVSNKAKRNNL